MDYIRLDLACQAVEVPTLAEATHISMDLHMDLVRQCEDFRTKNDRLHAKMMQEAQAKKRWRERAKEAAVLGKRPARSRPKREIVSRRDGYYEVMLVELDAQTAEEALAEALQYLRTDTINGRLHRITDPGTGCWEAEVEVPLSMDAVRPLMSGRDGEGVRR